MKKQKILLCLFSVILVALVFCLPIFAKEAQISNDTKLYVGGMPFGAKITSKGLTVVKFSETQGDNASSAYAAGIRQGDIIVKINNTAINTIEDFVKQIDKCEGKPLTISVLRNNKELSFTVTPKYSRDDGKYKTGIWVKDSTSGIGTVTYIDPKTNEFGGLGHAICDCTTGKIVPLTRGIVTDVSINGVIKGQSGIAGELKGSFEPKKIGTLLKNCDCGVFGVFAGGTIESPEPPVSICPKNQVREGEAYIWCTLDEKGPQKYNIQITNIDTSNSATKNFRIKVTDEKLLLKSGGIVQGMSGSPIIQNGKLVGAVTHVLINDPTQGYGIFIENMLAEAS